MGVYAGKVVLVTGGAKGVGRGISTCFLEGGATVVTCGRQAPDSLPAFDGREAEFVTADVRGAEACEALVGEVLRRHGRLDVLVNNAGGTPFAMASDASPRYHESIIRLNLLGPLLLSLRAQAVMATQAEGGVIINIGTVGAYDARPGSATYAAAKAGVLSLTRSLAVEWASRVRVVSVSPGLVLTEQAHLHYGDENGIAAVAKTVPLQRMATPRDIGEACAFLASPAAGYITGTDLLVHGGGERPSFLDAASVNHNSSALKESPSP